MVADVAGHGKSVAEISMWLRKLMRKNVNMLSVARLARALNEEYGRQNFEGRYATALFATYFAPRDHLVICNAGHPRPLWFRAGRQAWQFLDSQDPDNAQSVPSTNLPLGIIASTEFTQFAVALERDDFIMIYSDSFNEAAAPDGTRLGEEGLIELLRDLRPEDPQSCGRQIIDRLSSYRGGAPASDDQTLLILHNNATDPKMSRTMSVLAKVAKAIGLVEY